MRIKVTIFGEEFGRGSHNCVNPGDEWVLNKLCFARAAWRAQSLQLDIGSTLEPV